MRKSWNYEIYKNCKHCPLFGFKGAGDTYRKTIEKEKL